MDTRHKYLAGDIYYLENVNKISPRRFELPMFMQTKIQIKKNLYGIRNRLFRHMNSYDYKFRSLASEPKQVIRALRSRPSTRATLKKPLRITKIDRSLADSSSEWKLPPNVYRLGDFTTQRKQMGRRGPYQCFTVERDDKTVRNHFAPKPDSERCETDFYDLPSPFYDSMKTCNAYKNKFLKADRFADLKIDGTPPPTKYHPQNYTIKPKSTSYVSGKAKSKSKVDPVFYYPNTTVPEKEMEFNKPLITPEPGRYNIHHLQCRCHIKRCERNIFSGKIIRDEGHNLNRVDEQDEDDDENSDDFHSETESEESVEKVKKKLKKKKKKSKHGAKTTNRREREPISFRVKRSKSLEDLSTTTNREIRFNTMIKKRNLYSTKTGRPVGFLSAAPRFEEAEKPIKLYEREKKETLQTEEEKNATDSKPKVKGMTEKRLKELATPKQTQTQTPKRTKNEKIQVITKCPETSFRSFADKLRVVQHASSSFSIFGLRKLRENKAKQQREEEQVNEEDLVDDSQLSAIVISNK
ncbi:hypothetical protein PVAND_003151 [Polypedilum vanderplanki]|uniref:Uncharacterized protein n=1 Tax=Polypedilum vanderplanki TaxID=319348 RepID=A0A9J6BT73_POLVA|nr:hypothetical protein PVAND_003151 [Polypedilum vanderplanki]